MLIDCPECKKEISSDAKFCPQCGADIQKKKKAESTLGGFAIAIVVCVLLFNKCTSDDTAKTQSSSAQPAQSSASSAEKPRQPTVQERFLALSGKPSIEALSDELAGRQISLGITGENLAAVKAALEVSNPIEDKGDYIFGSGCAKDKCGSFEAAFTVNKQTYESGIVLLKDGQFTGWRISEHNAPEAIRNWIQERKRLF